MVNQYKYVLIDLFSTLIIENATQFDLNHLLKLKLHLLKSILSPYYFLIFSYLDIQQNYMYTAFSSEGLISLFHFCWYKPSVSVNIYLLFLNSNLFYVKSKDMTHIARQHGQECPEAPILSHVDNEQ